MSQYTVMLSSSATRTRVLLLDGRDELLRAVLPPGRILRHRRAASALLEGLSLWLDGRLSVVLSGDEAEASYFLDLVDDLGIPARSVFFEVKLVERRARRPPRRLRGVSDFADLRQLSLLAGEAGR
jgi:hypothetical protein